MSATDFYNGQQSRNLAASLEVAEANRSANRAIAQWKFKLAKAESGRLGFAHLFKVMAEELRRVDPTNPLLQKERQLAVLGAKVAEKANEMGYLYDPKSGDLIPR